MLRAKFQDHRTSGSEKKIFKSFYHIWAWWPSWSCDLYHLYKLSFPLPRETPYKIWGLIGHAVSEKMFENNYYIHVYSPGIGADNPLGSNFFH